MKKIAIITARGGSKRIPRKNIKLFCGKPIIAYSIEAAINSKLFDEVMVSTDDDEIAQIAIRSGATLPFKRSAKASDDFATTADVLFEVITQYDLLGKHFDMVCCLYPTVPFITSQLLQSTFDTFIKENYDSLMPIVEYSVPIQIALQKNNMNRIEMIQPEFVKLRTQDMKKTYYDPGQFYWIKKENFMNTKQIFNENTGGYLINEINAHDIDTLSDWEIAEFKYSFLKQKKTL